MVTPPLPPCPPEDTSPVQPEPWEASDIQMESDTCEEPSCRQKIGQSLMVVWVYLGTQIGVAIILGVILGIIQGVLEGFMDTYLDIPAMEAFDTTIALISALASGVLALLYGLPRLAPQGLKGLLKNNPVTIQDWLGGIPLVFTLYLPLMLVLNLLQMLLGQWNLSIPEAGSLSNSSFWGIALYMILALLIAPVFEELVFRGLILNGLRRFNTAFALIFSSMLFGMLHMNLYQGIPVMGMAMAFGLMYLKTDSLRLCIGMHMANNAYALLANLFSGSQEGQLIFGIVTLLLAAIGFWYLIRQRQTFNRLLGLKQMDLQACFDNVLHSASFWLFAVVFLLLSGLDIFSSSLNDWSIL